MTDHYLSDDLEKASELLDVLLRTNCYDTLPPEKQKEVLDAVYLALLEGARATEAVFKSVAKRAHVE